MRDGVRLERNRTALAIVDVQERLFGVMEPEQRDAVARNLKVLAAAARRLGVPVLLTEQYPKGLGPILPELREALGPVVPVEKLTFSCCGAEAFTSRLRATGARAVILAGLEAHVCVLLTALDLMADGYTVHVPADATASRSRWHRELGLAYARSEGAVITTTETVVYQLLGEAGTDEFRALAPLLR